MAKAKNAPGSEDKLILDSYKTCMEGLAVYLGGAFEFVLHDLYDLDHSVIKIVNGSHSGRREGAPITDLALSMLKKISEKKGPPYISYYTKNRYGKPVKALTAAIFGKKNRVIGLLCINFYYETPISQLLESFFAKSQSNYESESFINNSDELIRKSLEKTKKEVYADGRVLPSQKNKEIINLLYYQGIFKLKDAVKMIARDLGITSNTVYMHIRSLEMGK
jgi:predicted transcriptional regulator YheO